jgi:hypothetical protein
MSQLKMRATLFADMAKGGYLQTYDILEGDQVVGHKKVSRENRSSHEIVQYFLDKTNEAYATREEFLTAYEASLK